VTEEFVGKYGNRKFSEQNPPDSSQTQTNLPPLSGGLTPYYSLTDLVESLERPRKVMIMVKAGSPVDAVIADLVPLLEA
jgi:6-phosphogluconate dehydrogenase